MKAICERNSLLSACQLVSAVLPSRDIKPILKNFKAIGHDGACTLLGTDLEIGLRLTVKGVVLEEPGECILPASRLIAILRETPDKELSLDASPAACLVRGAQAEFELLGEDPEQFPDVPAFTGEAYHEITAGTLREMIRRTLFAAADDAGRYSMCGVYWELEGAVCRLVATDGKRMAITEGVATATGAQVVTGLIVPTKAMSILERNLADDPGGTVRIAFQKNEVLFQTERAVLYSRLVEGRFPDYRKVLPKHKAVKLILPVAPLASAIRQAAIVAEDESRRVDLIFKPGLLTLQAQGATAGRSKVDLPVPYEGADLTVGFNPDYLTSFFKVLPPNSEVVVDLIDSKTPVLFHVGSDYKYLAMPLT